MSAKKSEMLSAVGTVWEIVKTIWNAVLELGGTDEDMRKVLKPGGAKLASDLALVILGRASVVVNEVVTVQENINLESWVNFYQKHFDLTADFSGLKIPQKPTEGNWRLLVIPQGLTNNQVYDACAKQFPCWRYKDDLDAPPVPTNERGLKDDIYAIWVRDAVEADNVHQKKSANMVQSVKMKTETLLERMLHELKYFLETGKHLDLSKTAFCICSRNSDGNVSPPYAHWDETEFHVYWGGNDYRYGDLRSRGVVS